MKRYKTTEVAKRLGLCLSRIITKLKEGHFPNHEWCECGRTVLIPERDLKLPQNKGKRK
jgi:hypothetical protein